MKVKAPRGPEVQGLLKKKKNPKAPRGPKAPRVPKAPGGPVKTRPDPELARFFFFSFSHHIHGAYVRSVVHAP